MRVEDTKATKMRFNDLWVCSVISRKATEKFLFLWLSALSHKYDVIWRERRAGRCEAPRRSRCPSASSRSGNEADACPPPRPSGLRLADLLASLLARYIPQRVCASLAPCHQACEPAAYVIIFMGRDTKLSLRRPSFYRRSEKEQERRMRL